MQIRTSEVEGSTNVESFLGAVVLEMKAIKAARKRYAVKLSPDFNCFDYIEHRETRLSRIIADLLDPEGNHAQGDKFLAAFLGFINVDWDTRITSLDRDKKNPDDRRPDIKIIWEDHKRIDIENKPRAKDLELQVSSYVKALQNWSIEKNRPWHLVYLSGPGREPTSISPEELGKLKDSRHIIIKSYRELIKWIMECISVCESERFRWFLGEFKMYVMAEFMGVREMNERQSVVKQTLESRYNFKAAWEVAHAMEDTKKELLKRLEQQLNKHISQKPGWKLVWDQNFGEADSGFSIFFLPENEQQFVLRFEFDDSYCKGFGWGIKKMEKNLQGGGEIAKIMLDKIGARESDSEEWWLWSAQVEEVFKDWESSSEPWTRILEDRNDNKQSLADYIFQKAEKVHNFFKEDNKLDLLKG